MERRSQTCSTSDGLCETDFGWGYAGRASSAATDKGCAGHQPKDGQGPRPEHPTYTDFPRRRGDRITQLSDRQLGTNRFALRQRQDAGLVDDRTRILNGAEPERLQRFQLIVAEAKNRQAQARNIVSTAIMPSAKKMWWRLSMPELGMAAAYALVLTPYPLLVPWWLCFADAAGLRKISILPLANTLS